MAKELSDCSRFLGRFQCVVISTEILQNVRYIDQCCGKFTIKQFCLTKSLNQIPVDQLSFVERHQCLAKLSACRKQRALLNQDASEFQSVSVSLARFWKLPQDAHCLITSDKCIGGMSQHPMDAGEVTEHLRQPYGHSRVTGLREGAVFVEPRPPRP